MLGFKKFSKAAVTLSEIELAKKIRKVQIRLPWFEYLHQNPRRQDAKSLVTEKIDSDLVRA